MKKGLLPFASKKIAGKYLVTTYFGSWAILDKVEFELLQNGHYQEDGTLCKKLEEKDIMVTENSINSIIKNYRNLNANLFEGPGLHIVSITSKCNFDCSYCHAGSPVNEDLNMTKETASKVLEFVFNSPNQKITIEFQGGEPTMNWEVLQFIVKNARKLNELTKKDLRITLVTNLSLMTDKRLQYLLDHDVIISTSLDGPPKVHNANRPFVGGAPTHDRVVDWIKKIQEKTGSSNYVNALTTITRQCLPYAKEIVDEYVRIGFKSIHLRFLNYLGVAKNNWSIIGYSSDEFLKFWKEGLDHIIELNKQGASISERMAIIMLTKILKKQDPRYTELMSPCGAGRTQILYNEDGRVFTCDEGRMTEDELFKMGNVLTDHYNQVMGSSTMLHTLQVSMMNLYTPTNVYLPWIGTCPVENHAQGSVVPQMACSSRFHIYDGMFTYLFEKMITDPDVIPIFEKWLGIDGKESVSYN